MAKNSTIYYTPTSAECPQCRAVVPAVEYYDDDLLDMDFTCQQCGHEEISAIKCLAQLNQGTLKGGYYAI